jgi:hypothetical protein
MDVECPATETFGAQFHSFMRNTMTALLFVSLALGYSSAAVCEGKSHPGIIAFYVSQSAAKGSVSEEWLSAFRDLLVKSPAYCLVEKREVAAVVLSIVGLDTEGRSAAVSIALYFAKDQAFLAHWMYASGKENVESSAQRALVVLDNEVKDLKRLRLLK